MQLIKFDIAWLDFIYKYVWFLHCTRIYLIWWETEVLYLV